MLYGRAGEQSRIADLVSQARTGASAVLVLRGEPGIGKTGLLDWAAATPGVAVLRAGGVEFEAELPFAGLSQLLRPALDRLDRLPAPQRAALAAAFGLAPGDGTPDRLLIGLAVLSLLSDYAGDRPLLCLIDDAHWLDSVSTAALTFAARRLHAEGIVMILAAREGGFGGPGLPELTLTGLPPEDAARLIPDGTDPAVRGRTLAEAQGNPLALTELPRVLTGGQTGGPVPLTDRLLAAFHGQVGRLPDTVRALLLVVAAADTGDPAVLLSAARSLGAGPADMPVAQQARLLDTGPRLTFRHPLVRAAVYQQAAYPQRLAAHRALAAAMTAPDLADRRAWHLAAATTGPDEDVARALENSAAQARARHGYGAAMAAFERAAELTADAVERARRLLLAAENGLRSGNMPAAVRLAENAGSIVQEPAFLARVAFVEGQAWFWQGVHKTAYELMTAGADLDPDSAALQLVHAFHPAWHLGEPQLTDCLDRLSRLDHPVARFQVDSVRGRPPALDEAAATPGLTSSDLVLLCGLGLVAGQDAQTRELAVTVAARCRADGIVGVLPTLLFFLAEAELFTGRHRDAAISLDDGLRVARDADQPTWVSQLVAARALLAAIDGDEARCRELAAEARDGAESGGQAWAVWAVGLLDLGAGRAGPALAALESLQENPYAHQVCAHRSVPDLVEAAVRAGEPARAVEPLRRFTAWADRVGQDWARALVYRCEAMLSGEESSFRAAIDLGARPFEQARTELLYGEWLRRGKRKAEARSRLQRALETFERLGARPWADRARTELTATGLQLAGGTVPAGAPLTPQELQIARLAGRGLSNKDIAAHLFLSPKTVAYHLYKAYPKLGVGGRQELSALGL